MKEKTSKQGLESSSLTRRTAYTLAAGAAVGIAADSPEADAAVQYFTGDISVQQGYILSLFIDQTDSDYDITLSNYVFPQGPYQGAFLPYAPGRFVGFLANGFYYASALTPGTYIDAGSLGPSGLASLAYGAANPNAQFNNVTDGYLGFAFPIGGVNHFAWMRVDIDNAAGSFIVRDWAYEDDPNVGITIGDTGGLAGDLNLDGFVDGRDFLLYQRDGGATFDSSDFEDWQNNYGSSVVPAVQGVPEPGSLGLLAAGSAGLALLRQRRKPQSQKAKG